MSNESPKQRNLLQRDPALFTCPFLRIGQTFVAMRLEGFRREFRVDDNRSAVKDVISDDQGSKFVEWWNSMSVLPCSLCTVIKI